MFTWSIPHARNEGKAWTDCALQGAQERSEDHKAGKVGRNSVEGQDDTPDKTVPSQ